MRRMQALRDLKQSEIEHSQMISQHVQHWTPQAVQEDWSGYRAATRKVLDRARDLVMTEKNLLVLFLRQLSGRRRINP